MNHFSKQQCMDKDWKNTKEITAKEIAYCIYVHNFDTEDVPNHRLKAVNEELMKIRKKKEAEVERGLIEAELAIYEYSSSGKGWGGRTDNIVDYEFEPNLFQTTEEVIVAFEELWSILGKESTKLELLNHEYKNSNYSRDMQRMQKTMENVKKQYVKLGGSEEDFNKNVKQIPRPHKGTLKQDVYLQRESIKERFMSLGVSHTRADDIAKAITTKAYKELF